MDIKFCTDRGKINSTPELSYKRHREGELLSGVLRQWLSAVQQSPLQKKQKGVRRMPHSLGIHKPHVLTEL